MSRYPSESVHRMDQQFAETEEERSARLRAKRLSQRAIGECAREQRLAIALQAAIRWPYMVEMWSHIRDGVHDEKYDPSYLNDIASIADGVSAAAEIGIVALTDSQVKTAQR